MLVTDYTFGRDSHLLYSTASIFFAGRIGTRDVLFLFGDSDQSHEFSLPLSGNRGIRPSQSNTNVKFSSLRNGYTTVTIFPGIEKVVSIWESDTQIILFSDPVTAASFWAPPLLPTASSDPLKNYWQFGSTSLVLVGGPYLLRNATLSRSGELSLRGDLNQTTQLTVIAPDEVRTITWNGIRVSMTQASFSTDDTGSFKTSILTGNLPKRIQPTNVEIPSLSNWKFGDSLPEIQPGFDDSRWIIANHTSTNIVPKPSFGDGRVLYGEFVGNFQYAIISERKL